MYEAGQTCECAFPGVLVADVSHSETSVPSLEPAIAPRLHWFRDPPHLSPRAEARPRSPAPERWSCFSSCLRCTHQPCLPAVLPGHLLPTLCSTARGGLSRRQTTWAAAQPHTALRRCAELAARWLKETLGAFPAPRGPLEVMPCPGSWLSSFYFRPLYLPAPYFPLLSLLFCELPEFVLS